MVLTWLATGTSLDFNDDVALRRTHKQAVATSCESFSAAFCSGGALRRHAEQCGGVTFSHRGHLDQTEQDIEGGGSVTTESIIERDTVCRRVAEVNAHVSLCVSTGQTGRRRRRRRERQTERRRRRRERVPVVNANAHRHLGVGVADRGVEAVELVGCRPFDSCCVCERERGCSRERER